MPDKSAKCVGRLKVDPKGERSESSSNSLNSLDPGLRRGDGNLNYVRFWTNTKVKVACAELAVDSLLSALSR